MFGFLRRKKTTPEPSADNILPLVKHLNFLAAVRDIKIPPNDSPIPADQIPLTRPLVGDLLIAYGFDLGDRLTMVTPALLGEVGVEPGQLHELAMSNYLASAPTVEPQERDSVFLLSAGNSLTASLMFHNAFWNCLTLRFGTELVVAVPTREAILFARLNDEEAHAPLCYYAAEAHAWDEVHSLSEHLLIWRDARWVDYKPWA